MRSTRGIAGWTLLVGAVAWGTAHVLGPVPAKFIGGGLAPVSGRIGLFGNDITNMPPHARRRAGLCRTFQKIRLFESLSVVDNVRVAATEEHRP